MTPPEDDVLFRGPDVPRNAPRPLLLVAAVVAVLALLAWRLIASTGSASETKPAPHRAITTASPHPVSPAPLQPAPSGGEPSRLATPSPPESAVSAAMASAHRLPQPRDPGVQPPVGALPLGEPTMARLLLAGSRLLDVDLDSGSVTESPQAGRIIATLRVRGGDVLLIADPTGGAGSAVFAAKGQRVAVDLGSADALVPAVDDRHVWLELPGGSILQEVDLRGNENRTIELGRGRRAIRETPFGMVTTSALFYSESLELWDIAAHRVAKTLWVATNIIVVASDADRTAFVLPSCSLPPACPIEIAQHASADVVALPMPAGWTTAAAAFSPDGARLAVIGHPITAGQAGNPALLVVDLRTRAAQLVAGVATLTNRSTLLTWTPDSLWFFAVAGTDAAPLLGYRLGDRRVRNVPFPRRASGLGARDVMSLSAY